MFESDQKSKEEAERIDRTITTAATDAINRLKPLFCVMCGDLTHAYPPKSAEEGESDDYQSQVQLFLELWGKVDPSVPIICMFRIFFS